MDKTQMGGRLYLIERLDKDTDYRYYAEHGEIGGIPDVIGYEVPDHARKFRAEEEALNFIRTELPGWGRELHRPVGACFADFDTADALQLRTMLWHGLEIPDSLLNPTVGRLRLWRCSGECSRQAKNWGCFHLRPPKYKELLK